MNSDIAEILNLERRRYKFVEESTVEIRNSFEIDANNQSEQSTIQVLQTGEEYKPTEDIKSSAYVRVMNELENKTKELEEAKTKVMDLGDQIRT